MTRSDVLQGIQQFIEQTFMVEFDESVNAETDLFEADYIDSFGFIEMVTHIEQTFEVSLSDDDLAAPEIGTLNGIVDTILRKKNSGE